tara:strand:- start:9959 stop:10315 length:357 start_codon:yes stop_codon:yes gene_type:complete
MSNFLTLPTLFLALSFSVYAQQSDIAYSQKDQFIDVVKVYEKVVEDGYESVQIYEKLATTNFERGQYAAAKKWFEKWFEKDKNPDVTAYLKYSQTLKELREFEKAKHYLDLYEKKAKK